MEPTFFDLKWYGLDVSEKQEPGYGKIEIAVSDPELHARQETDRRLVRLWEEGKLDDAPSWVANRLVSLGKIEPYR